MPTFNPSARCAIMAGVACVLFATPDRAGAQQPKAAPAQGTVLFICEHGTVKSLIAKVWFERYAAEAGLQMTALSRGTAVDSAVPPFMLAGLAADQFTLGSWHSQALAPADLANAAFVVSFDVPAAASAAAPAPRQQWDGLPSVSANFANGRDAIKARVRQLVDSLKRARDKRG